MDYRDWFSDDGPHTQVRGFITHQSRAFFTTLLEHQDNEGIRGNLVEIGVFHGKTLLGLALAARDNEKVVGFDIFPGDIGAQFKASLSHLEPAPRSRVTGYRVDTATLSFKNWDDRVGAETRFVHVDGGHNYEAVLHDALLASSNISENGVVVFDDFFHDWYPDVTQGILHFLQGTDLLRPVAIVPRSGDIRLGGSKLICCPPKSVESYTNLLANRFSDRSVALRKISGSKVLTFQNFP